MHSCESQCSLMATKSEDEGSVSVAPVAVSVGLPGTSQDSLVRFSTDSTVSLCHLANEIGHLTQLGLPAACVLLI